MDIYLTDIEARVLGSLVEKEITTPEYYPLSLNALVNACNQKSNRDPLMSLDEEAVKQALRSLDAKDLAGPANTMDSRVAKYEQRLAEMFNFTRQETAILCVLLLRGPQTVGELRTRAERMYPFDDINQVHTTLQRLMNRDPSLVAMAPRQAGTKEPRYAHLFSGDALAAPVHEIARVSPAESGRPADNAGRVARLEQEIEELKKDVEELKQQLAAFRKQFE